MRTRLATKTMAVVALALGSFSATPALARPIRPAARPGPVSGETVRDAGASAATRTAASTKGFDWTDAGIGAAGGVVLTLAGASSAAAIQRDERRPRRRRAQPALTH